MKPLFSIITIAFNSGKTIERTIKSVLNQTFDNYEYIVIDGGSSDGTLDIIKKYETLFNGRMKWKSEPDKGIYDAMNKGISLASGDIIGIVNSDDWLESDAIQNVNEALQQYNYDLNAIYCGWINFHYLNGDIQVLKTSQSLLEKNSSSYTMAGIRHPAVFIPKRIYEKQGIFDTRMKILADTDLILRLFFNGVKFNYINKTITNMSDGGVSNKNYIISTRDYKIILKKYNLSYFHEKALIFKYFSKMAIKGLIPAYLLKIYRQL